MKPSGWYYFKLVALHIACAVIATTHLRAQTDTTMQQVRLKDGNVLQGVITMQDSATITLRTLSLGTLQLKRSEIAEVKKLYGTSHDKTGEFWFENPHATRYFFGPSAINQRAGEGYYQNTYVLVNSAHVGITDNFSMGGGFEIISLFSGKPVFFLMPKVSGPVAPNWYAGGGALVVLVPTEDISYSLFYGIVTNGNRNLNYSVGLGYGYGNERLLDRPVATFSGSARLSRRVSLVSENWMVPYRKFIRYDATKQQDIMRWTYYPVFSYGLRFMGESISVDLGFLNNIDLSEVIFIGIPYVDFAIRFR